MGNAVAYRHSVAKQQTRKKLENCRKQRERTGGIAFNNNIHGDDGRKREISESHAGTSADSYVRISIGGKSYCVRTELFTPDETRMHRFVGSSHEDRLKMCDGFDQTTTEYYFERNSKLADHLIDYYSTGSLHRPTNVCAERFREELEFWEISLDHLSSCCTILAGDEATAATKKTKGFPQVADDFEPIFDGVCLGSFRLTLWRFLEDPQSSIPAAVFALFSVMFVFASVFGLILGSMPEFQEDSSMAEAYHNMHNRKVHPSDVGSHKFSSSQTLDQNPVFPNFVYKPTDNPAIYLVILEYVCIGWFTFEYTVRLIVYPRRFDFAKKTLNLIDLLTILPFYLELCLPLFGVYASKFKDFTGDELTLTRSAQTWMGAMLVIRVLRVLRMARVFKLARYSTSLQTFGHTLQSSITELSMLSMFLLTGIIFFSTIMYYLERDEPNTDFYSIPAGCWWCVVTMATVGYGDAKPVTTMGKLVATTTSICGIIVLAFPISMIVEKFASAQQKSIEETQLAQAQLSAAANNALLRRFPTRRKQRMRAIVESHDKLLSTVT